MEEPQKSSETSEQTSKPQEPVANAPVLVEPSQESQGPASAESQTPQQFGGSQVPQQLGNPQTPSQPTDQQTVIEQSELNTARTLATVATIGGPVSFIIGGVALSSVAVVCAAIAFSKVNKVLRNTSSPMYNYAKVLKQTAVMGLFIGGVALILNVVGMVTMMPKIMEAMQSGDFSSIIGTGTSGTQANPAPSSGGESAWG